MMSDNLKTKTICVVDNGLFVSFARMLAKGFKKTYYYCPIWKNKSPRSQDLSPGQGFDDIEYIKYPLQIADNIDLWVFLDLYHSDLQCYLEEHGASVWGARKGEELELHRWEFKQYLKRIGLPVGQADQIIGFQALREFLKTKRNKYIKTDIRGDFETFRHDSYTLSEPRLDELEHSLGPRKVNYEFVVEDEIPDAVEVGYDGFSVDGQWPSHAMMAYEVKDCGMIGVGLPYSKLADPVKQVNVAITPTLKGYNYRGFISTEIRYTRDKKPYFIDPCCRLGTPSNELLQTLFENWPQVLWDGAVGKLTSPTPKSKFCVMAVICSEWAVNDWQALHYPAALDDFVKLRFHTRINGKDYVAPQPVGLPDLGGVVGAGNTLLEAIKQCKERAAQIKGYQVKCELGSIDKALEVIAQGEKMGIKFGEGALPTAVQVRAV